MSITKQVTVWCDCCGAWDQASMTTAELRRHLKKRGWKTAVEGGRDYCPACANKKQQGGPR